MINANEALTIARTKVEELLVTAELVNGLGLSKDEIKAEKKPLFWYIANTNITGSLESTYIVYNIPTLPTTKHGDGVPLIRRPVVIIDIYTKKRIIDTLLKQIEDVFVDSLKNCEIINVTYSTSEKRFIYQLEVLMDVMDEPDGA